MTEGAEHKRVVLVTGASSQIGDALLPMLTNAGHGVIALGRRGQPGGGVGRTPAATGAAATRPVSGREVSRSHDGPAVTWVVADLSGSLDLSCQAHALVHCAPLWLLPDRVGDFADAGVTRLIAFGSTSVMTKVASGSAHEQDVVRKLADAEAAVAKQCKVHGIDWTLFRPTLIYGRGRDANVTTIARFIRKYRFFPLVGGGRGLRQPVHADDLADACVRALSKPASFNCAYNLTGGETLTYRDMVTRIFEGLDIMPRHLPLPRLLLRTGLRLLSVLPGYRHVTPDMADRITVDLCFDHDDAIRDFGYTPRPFSFRL